MKTVNNYRLQVEGAKKYFLRYDQQALIAKLKLRSDASWIYVRMFAEDYRIHRESGAVERLEKDWVETNDHSRVMTLLDLNTSIKGYNGKVTAPAKEEKTAESPKSEPKLAYIATEEDEG